MGLFGGFARCTDPAGENSHTRQFSGQRADQLRPGDRYDFGGLRHSKLGVPFGHNLRGLGTKIVLSFEDQGL